MKKWIFTDVCDRIAQVSEIRWIDAQEGQLNFAERPPVAFPCCLVDLSYPVCKTLSGGKQQVSLQITLQVAFEAMGQTNTKAPAQVRDRALDRLDTLEKIHQVLQWWSDNTKLTPLMRKRVTTERRSDGRKVYTMVYESSFFD